MLDPNTILERLEAYRRESRRRPRYLLLGYEEHTALRTKALPTQLYFRMDGKEEFSGIEVLEVNKKSFFDVVA